MKKILFAVFAAVSLVCSAQTRQSTSQMALAKRLVRMELMSTLHDYSSYEPVYWSSVDSLYSAPEDDYYVQRAIDRLVEKHSQLPFDSSNTGLFDDLSELEAKCKDSFENAKANNMGSEYLMVCLKQWTAISDFMSAQENAVEAINRFNPEFIGWSVTHRFRAKNAFGTKVINAWVVKFDINMTSITSIEKQ